LSIELGLLNEAFKLCEVLQEDLFWKKLGDYAMMNGDFEMASSAYT